MSRARSKWLGVGACLWLGAVLCGAPARAGNVAPAKADAAVRAGWARDIRAAHECDVQHVENRTRPALFPTTLPCQYVDAIRHADGTLEWEGTDPIAELLASVVEGPVMSGREQPACDDSSQGDQITIGFAKGKKSLTMTFFPLGGTLHVQDGRYRVEFFDLDRRTGDLVALLARSLPSDTRLSAIVPCPGRIDALGVAALVPEACNLFAVDELPEAVKQVKPVFPRESQERDEEGTVLVQALVDTLGHVSRTRIARSVAAFDESAVRAVEQWQFKPAIANKRRVAVWVAVPVKFRLTD